MPKLYKKCTDQLNFSKDAAFGILLSIEHLLVIIFWLTIHPIKDILATSAFCWPFWENCALIRGRLNHHLDLILTLYGLLAVGTLLLFFFKGRQGGRFPLAILVISKNLIIFSDLRLAGNYHSIVTIVALTYIFLKDWPLLSRVWVVLIYFFAGLLKFNQDWISGELIERALVPAAYKSAAAIYAIFLECVLCWLLFSKNKWLFWLTLIQFFVFHILSVPSVHFFYPLMMLILLTPFILYPPYRYPISWKWSPVAYVAVFVFIIVQIPQHILHRDTALTGEGRLLALIMYDAKTTCDVYIISEDGNETQVETDWPFKLMPRVHCDPLYYWSYIREKCRENPELRTHLFVRAKRWSDDRWTRTVAENDICSKQIYFNPIMPNSWIGTKSEALLSPAVFQIQNKTDNAVPSSSSQISLSDSLLRLTQDGQTIWTMHLRSDYNYQMHPHRSGLIYISSLEGEHFVINPVTTQIIWYLHEPHKLGGYKAIIKDDTIIIPSRQEAFEKGFVIYAMKLSTGELIKSSPPFSGQLLNLRISDSGILGAEILNADRQVVLKPVAF